MSLRAGAELIMSLRTRLTSYFAFTSAGKRCQGRNFAPKPPNSRSGSWIGATTRPTIPAFTTVQIACKVTGFRVADGNTWWYRIASSPWSGTFYVSADAFYNNGATSGSLVGTPFVDPNVPNC